jgi:Ser/Thr protein kinase RdoA (MazF antagonist)
LLLELVPGNPVRQCTLDAWIAAAAWLGRLQGFFAGQSQRVRSRDLLLRYGAEFLWSQAERAARHVVGVSAPLAKQLSASLERYERAVPAMVGWPPTLVHGHYRPYNVLVDGTLEPPRVCPVDWERAGFGPPAYDFAYLAEGFDPQRLDLLGEAYRAEAARHALSVPDPEELSYLANAFRVHRMLSLLGSAVDRRFTDAEVSKLVTLVSQLCDSL